MNGFACEDGIFLADTDASDRSEISEFGTSSFDAVVVPAAADVGFGASSDSSDGIGQILKAVIKRRAIGWA